MYSRPKGIKPGVYIRQCGICQGQRYIDEMRLNWQNIYVCTNCFEPKPELFRNRPIPKDRLEAPKGLPRTDLSLQDDTIKVTWEEFLHLKLTDQ